MGLSTQFYRSQVGDPSVINYGYTDKPAKLFAKDVYYFFVYLWALPWVIMPAYPYGGELDELYPNRSNMFCLLVHVVLFVLQLAFLLALPISLFFPVWMVLAALAAFLTFNYLLCRMNTTLDLLGS